MSDTVRHIRIDDDLWETIQALPGKTTSDKLRGLLVDEDAQPETVRDTRIDELLELARRRLEAAPDTRIDEILEHVQTIAGTQPDCDQVESIVDGVMQRKIDERAAKGGQNFNPASTSAGPGNGFPIQCAHCRSAGRGSTKYSTLCFDCKGAGHTLTPAECPECCDAGTGAL